MLRRLESGSFNEISVCATHRISQHECLQFFCCRHFVLRPGTRARYQIRNSLPAIGDGKAFAGFYLPQQFWELCFRFIRTNFDLHDFLLQFEFDIDQCTDQSD